MNKQLFSLGTIVATPGVLAAYSHLVNFMGLLHRHSHGDWGDMCEEDKQRNTEALQTGERIFSSYDQKGGKIWIITEADRSSTCILLPEDY